MQSAVVAFLAAVSSVCGDVYDVLRS